MRPWRQIRSAQLLHDRWLSVRADTCQLPNGKTLEPYYVIESNDWVHVFAVNPAGQVLTVTQFRYAAKAVCTELPGGVIDDGETPLAAAQRELLEETGFRAARWTALGTAYANPARQTNRIHMYLAEDLDAGGSQSLDESEEIVHTFVTPDEIRSQIRAGEFSQSLHIATFYLCLEYLSERA